MINNTVKGWASILPISAICILAGLGFYAASAQTPTPVANMQYVKSAQVDGYLITWTLQASNSGNADSTSQTVQDTLPAGADWVISTDDIGCNLYDSSIPGRLKLECDPFIVQKRHLNATEDDFLNGLRTVRVSGVVDKCGIYTNTALFNTLTIRSTTVIVPCPAIITATPTMSPTPITTPEPTTPVPTATQPISTPTPRIVPLPPNTGNTEPAGVRDGTYDVIMVSAMLILSALIVFTVGQRKRK